MRKLVVTGTVVALLMPSFSVLGHGLADTPTERESSRKIEFPDTENYLTLVVDLHTHSVFSDGHVWPRIRVSEAMRDGLDAMAITEHLEYQPHIKDIPHPDRNASYQDALSSLPEGEELIIIAGTEITRNAPHGHINAVFISDANTMFDVGDLATPYEMASFAKKSREWPAENAVNEANKQGAFVFWNHSWTNFDNEKTQMSQFHRQLVKDDLLHGIEVANGNTYSPESFEIALRHNLTPIGVSDVHELIDWDYEPHKGGHRPVNLVFAKERSAESIREALMERRALVWFRNLLIGKQDSMDELLKASLKLTSARYEDKKLSVLTLTFANLSDANFELENLTKHSFKQTHSVLQVPPHGTTTVDVRMDKRVPREQFKFRVLNALTEPDKHPEITFDIEISNYY